MKLKILDRPSPNFGPRAGGRRPDMLILHYTAMRSAERAAAWLCNPASKVSSHYLVDEEGLILRLVDEKARAWHAGASRWAGESDLNSYSIGIEIHNRGHDDGYPDFPEAQMARLEALCADIVERHQIPRFRVLAHSDVAPSRKIDPGEKFDWRRLWRAGIGAYVPPAPIRPGPSFGEGNAGPRVAELQQRLAALGYGLEATRVYDRPTVAVVTAFQRHWRPGQVDGRADPSTRATLDRLLALRAKG